MREWLPALALRRPVTVLMGLVAALVLGLVAYVRIPVQLMPDGFETRSMWLRVPYPNASPIETDERVVKVLREELSTLPGLKRLRTRASENSAGFGLEFHNDVAMDVSYNEVIDRIERALPDLPDEARDYRVFKFDPNDAAVLYAGITFDEQVEDPYGVVTDLVVPRLERVAGVAAVDTWGVPGRRLFVDYDREKLLALGVDVGDVQRRLQTDNVQLGSGRVVSEGRVRHVRGLARLDDAATLRAWPVRDGLALAAVADVSLRGVVSADIDRLDGKANGGLAVRKDAASNTVEVTRAVVAALEELEADPRLAGVNFAVWFDQGDVIQSSNDTLVTAALQGGALSVVVLLAFLRAWRMTLLISAAIPGSLLVTVGVLYLMGASLNLVAMMGLMLAVGMVVDNAIVVVEAIWRRRALGEGARSAAVGGAGDVGLAILASTSTTMATFLPVILMTERAEASFFLRALGTPVILALAASLLIALLVAPLATLWVPGSGVKPDPRWLDAIRTAYVRLLDAALARRWDTLVTLLAVLMLTGVVAGPAISCGGGGGSMMRQVRVGFSVPNRATPDEREDIVVALEEALEPERDRLGIEFVVAELDAYATQGDLELFLRDDAPMTLDEVADEVKKLLPKEIPGVRTWVGWDASSDKQRLTLPVYGENLRVLDEIGAATEVEEDGSDEVRVLPDRDALARHGIDARVLATTVASALRGVFLDPLITTTGELDVEARISVADRSRVDQLLDFPVATPTGLVPVRAVARVELGKGAGTIRRIDGRTSVEVTVDIARDAAREDVSAGLKATLAGMELPRGYSVDTDAWRADQAEEDSATMLALLMSVVFVFLLMGMLFESWILPLGILVTIPLAGVGAAWALVLTGTDLDTMAGVGMVVLVGVVVNNGIVLIDRVVSLRREGVEREEAVRRAGGERLRPILMTAVTTIVGLVPMALGSSDFVGIPYAPLGRVVIGGMVASTALTLVFLPWLYLVLDDLSGAAMAVWARLRSSRPIQGAA